MSELKNQINENIKTSMKARDVEKLKTLRSLMAEIKNFEINNRKEIEDNDVYAILAKGIKTRQDSIEQYLKANRTDLADIEDIEIKIYQEYLPTQLNSIELVALVVDAIEEAEAKTQKDIGKVMKIISPQVKGRADMKMVNELIKKHLVN